MRRLPLPGPFVFTHRSLYRWRPSGRAGERLYRDRHWLRRGQAVPAGRGWARRRHGIPSCSFLGDRSNRRELSAHGDLRPCDGIPVKCRMECRGLRLRRKLSVFSLLRRRCRSRRLRMYLPSTADCEGTGNPSSESGEQEVAAIARRLKAMAKELKVPVLSPAQLNQGVDTLPLPRATMPGCKHGRRVRGSAVQPATMSRRPTSPP